MTKQEYNYKYNNSPGNEYRKAHKEYYSQYVNDDVKQIVLEWFGLDAIMNSTCHHFSNVPKENFEKAFLQLKSNHFIQKLIENNGDDFNSVVGYSILKEAAKQIRKNEYQTY